MNMSTEISRNCIPLKAQDYNHTNASVIETEDDEVGIYILQ